MRTHFGRFGLGALGLAIAVMALALISQGTTPSEATHGQVSLDPNIDFMSLDAEVTGNSSTGLDALEPPFDTCVDAAASSTVSIDIVVDAVPNIVDVLTGTGDRTGVTGIQAFVRYDSALIDLDTNNDTFLNDLSTAGSLLTVNGLSLASPSHSIITTVGSIRTDFVAIADLSTSAGSQEDNILGTGIRLVFDTGAGPTFTTVEMLEVAPPSPFTAGVKAGTGTELSDMVIGNFTGSSVQTIFVAIAPATCGTLDTDISISKSATTITPVGAPDVNTGESFTIDTTATVTNTLTASGSEDGVVVSTAADFTASATVFTADMVGQSLCVPSLPSCGTIDSLVGGPPTDNVLLSPALSGPPADGAAFTVQVPTSIDLVAEATQLLGGPAPQVSPANDCIISDSETPAPAGNQPVLGTPNPLVFPTALAGNSYAVTETWTITCANPSGHAITIKNNFTFNSGQTDIANLNDDDITPPGDPTTFPVIQEVDIDITTFTQDTIIPLMTCTTDFTGGGELDQFALNNTPPFPAPLVPFGPNFALGGALELHEDSNFIGAGPGLPVPLNGVYDIGEGIYADTAPPFGTLSVGDFRLLPPVALLGGGPPFLGPPFGIGAPVGPGDFDLLTLTGFGLLALAPFGPLELHEDTGSTFGPPLNFTYDPTSGVFGPAPEQIYGDLDASGTVTAGDDRLLGGFGLPFSAVQGFPLAGAVVTPDTTFGPSTMTVPDGTFAGVDSEAGKAIALPIGGPGPPTGGPIDRFIISNTVFPDTVTVSVPWNVNTTGSTVPGTPLDATVYVIADTTDETIIRADFCALLGFSENPILAVIAGNPAQAINNLPRVTTNVAQNLTFTKGVSLTAAGGGPDVNVNDTLTVELPDLSGAPGTQSALDFSTSPPTPVDSICSISTSPELLNDDLPSGGSEVAFAFGTQTFTCTESSFLDTDNDGSPNPRVQLITIRNDAVATNGHVTDTDASNNEDVRISNLVIAGASATFGLWSLPPFTPGYQAGIDESTPISLGDADPGLVGTQLWPGDIGGDNLCVTGVPCGTRSDTGTADESLAQGTGLNDDFDCPVGAFFTGTCATNSFTDETDPFTPIAGTITVVPSTWLVQSGNDLTLVNPALGDIPDGHSVGDFDAILRTYTDPQCTTGFVQADLPLAQLFDAAMPAIQPWQASVPGFIINEGPNFDPITGLTSDSSDANGIADISEDFVTAGVLADIAGTINVIEGDYLTINPGTTAQQSRVITGISSVGGTNDRLDVGIPFSPVPSGGLPYRISGVSSASHWPTNLEADAVIGGILGGLDGNPTTPDGPPVWARYVAMITVTSPQDTPINVVYMNAGATGYLSSTTTSDTGAPAKPGSPFRCSPLVVTSTVNPISAPSAGQPLVAGTVLRSCLSDADPDGPGDNFLAGQFKAGDQIFATTFVRADTGGKVTVADTMFTGPPSCSSQTDVSIAITKDEEHCVAANLAGNPSVEPVPADLACEAPIIPAEADGADDRKVTATVTNGLGLVSAPGVEVRLTVESSGPCEARWNLSSGTPESLTLEKRTTSGGTHTDIVSYFTGAIVPSGTDANTAEWDINCSGSDGDNFSPQPKVIASACSGGFANTSNLCNAPPDPDLLNNEVVNHVRVWLDENSDGDTIPNASDNCPFTDNQNQNDADSDGTGNACDTDDDNDTIGDTALDFTPLGGPDACTPGLPGPDLDALGPALASWQEDFDGVDDEDGCRDVDLGLVITGTTFPVVVSTTSSEGPLTATVFNNELYSISVSEVLSAISYSILPTVNPATGCTVDIEGAQVTQDADLNNNTFTDHLSMRTDVLGLGPLSTSDVVFNLTVHCYATGNHNYDIEGVACVTPAALGCATSTNTVTFAAKDPADLQVEKSTSVTVVPAVGPDVNTGENATVTVTSVVTNNGPGDSTSPGQALLNASASQVGGSDCGTIAPPVLTPATIPALASGDTQVVTEVYTINCADKSSHTFTFDNTVSWDGAAPLIDLNPANDTDDVSKSYNVIQSSDVRVNNVTVNAPASANIGDTFVVSVVVNVEAVPNSPTVGATGTISLSQTGGPSVCSLNPTGGQAWNEGALGPAVDQTATWDVSCSLRSNHTFEGNGTAVLTPDLHVKDDNTGNDIGTPSSDSTNIIANVDLETTASITAMPNQSAFITGNDVRVGSSGTMTTETVVTNNGPLSATVNVSRTVTAPGGPPCLVNALPSDNITTPVTLPANSSTTKIDNWTVTCSGDTYPNSVSFGLNATTTVTQPHTNDTSTGNDTATPSASLQSYIDADLDGVPDSTTDGADTELPVGSKDGPDAGTVGDGYFPPPDATDANINPAVSGLEVYVDNCLGAGNASQANSDGDNEGDLCDAVSSHDVAVVDNDPLTDDMIIFGPPAESISDSVGVKMFVNAKHYNFSGHDEHATLSLTLDSDLITGGDQLPDGCAAVTSLLTPITPNPKPIGHVDNINYEVEFTCDSGGLPPAVVGENHIQVTLITTHINLEGFPPSAVGSCTDTVDNDGDSDIDAADSDCTEGDEIGPFLANNTVSELVDLELVP